MNIKTTNKLNIVYLALAIIWPLVRAQYLGGIDGAGRFLMLLMIGAIAVNGFKLFRVPKLTYVWLAWIIYAIVNCKEKGFTSDVQSFPSWVSIHLVFPFISMLVAIRSAKLNFQGTSMALVVIYFIYLMLGVLGMASSGSYDVGTRYANELGNEFLNNSMLLSFYISILYSNKKIKPSVYFLVLFFLSFVILLSGERKALIAIFIIIFGSLYGMNRKKGKKAILPIVLLCICAGGAAFAIMRFTTFGERMANSFSSSGFEDSVFLKLMGDRAIQYYQGWHLFVDNIWTGIGLTNFRWENTFMEGLPFHTEYMVQLCECGVVGTVMYLVGLGALLTLVFRLVKKESGNVVGFVMLSVMIALITVSFVAWMYDCTYYFIVYGVIVGYYEGRKRKNPELRMRSRRKKKKIRRVYVAKPEHAS